MEYYTGLFQEFGEMADSACYMFSALALSGPILLVFSVFIATGHIGNPGGPALGKYNQFVQQWDDQGYAQFTAAFPATSSINVTLSESGALLDHTAAPTTTLELSPVKTVTPLNSHSRNQDRLHDALYFQGEIDFWGGANAWPTADQYVTLELDTATASVPQPVTIELYMCANVQTQTPCDDVPAVDSDTVVTAQAPSVAEAAPGRRRLTSDKGDAAASAAAASMCTAYTRQVTILQGITLTVQAPPKEDIGNWTLGTFNCGQDFLTLTSHISEALYTEDVSKLPWPGAMPPWCYEWGTLFHERPNTTVITLRSATDPYVMSGKQTTCTFKYGLDQAGYNHYAKEVIIPALALMSLSGLILSMLVVKYRRVEERRETLLKYGLGDMEGTPLAGVNIAQASAPSYGATAKRAGFSRVTSVS